MPSYAKDIWICLECGREYAETMPFPNHCTCGNWAEDFYRLKDAHDQQDEAMGKPLLGVKYASEVWEERKKRLSEKTATLIIRQPIESESQPAPQIDGLSMKKVQLQEHLTSKGIKFKKTATKAQLLELCK